MRKQLGLYLVLLSVVANIFLGLQLCNRDLHLNKYTWGNAVERLWHQVNMASLNAEPRAGGVMVTPTLEGALLALEQLEFLQSLPHYDQRVDDDDMRTLRQFLRYAQAAHEQAAKEQKENGGATAESVKRLRKVKEGLEFILRGQSVTNQAKVSRNPWNHKAWRAVWHDLAEGLKQMEFVPLPE